MPALNFQKQFVQKVESGEKRQTIRSRRKRLFKVNDKLILYCGMRTKHCRKLFETVCKEVLDVDIRCHVEIYLNDHLLTELERRDLCNDDGFDNIFEMCEWFEKTHGLPFHGQLVRW